MNINGMEKKIPAVQPQHVGEVLDCCKQSHNQCRFLRLLIYSSTLSLSSSSSVSLLRYKGSHPKLPPPHEPATQNPKLPPLLLYLKFNHYTTTIAKIQETHTQTHHHQTHGETHTKTHHYQIR
ncbi:hypothetical protein ACB098_03G026200 [Castanea mollissima]